MLARMLLFKREFLPAIRSGAKTQTIRLWTHRLMRTGQASHIPGVGRVRITLVEPVVLDDLTDADAVPDGFATADELRAELRSIYGEQLDQREAFRVVFELATEESPAAD